jgi:hypothetical protein
VLLLTCRHCCRFLQAWLFYEQGRPLDIVDASMKDYPEAEALRFVKVGLACTQAAPSGRPMMRQVAKMLTRPAAFLELEMRPPAGWPVATSSASSITNSASITCTEIVPR